MKNNTPADQGIRAAIAENNQRALTKAEPRLNQTLGGRLGGLIVEFAYLSAAEKVQALKDLDATTDHAWAGAADEARSLLFDFSTGRIPK